MEAPTIETARLRLRAHRLEDFPACRALWADPTVVRFIGGAASTEQQTWMRLLQYGGLWKLLGFGYWAVEERTSGAFVGEIGFADFRRELTPSIAGLPEGGWVLTPSMHGRGYATEALQAALVWADAHLKTDRTVCLIAPENAASLRVAAKCGYRAWQQTTFKGEPTALLARPAARPLSSRGST